MKCPEKRKKKDCYYPYYGVAPHTHTLNLTASWIGSTVLKDKKEWPENFKEDIDCPGLGTYNCPYKFICERRK